MSDYYDYEADEDCDELIDEQLREYEEERQLKDLKFKNAVAAEVKRQLSAVGAENARPAIVQIIKSRASGASGIGATKSVSCKCCSKRFDARVADLNRGWGKFCSKSCKAKKK